jgi:hypothetical protein
MTKKVSIKDSAKQTLVDKERFVQNLKPLTDDDFKASKQNTRVKAKGTHNASVYIPLDVWVKFKTFELEQSKRGINVSFNKVVIELLQKEFKNY